MRRETLIAGKRLRVRGPTSSRDAYDVDGIIVEVHKDRRVLVQEKMYDTPTPVNLDGGWPVVKVTKPRKELTFMEQRGMWEKRFGVTHAHCPEECEHPQPFFTDDGRFVCGVCAIMHKKLSPIVPCTPATCKE